MGFQVGMVVSPEIATTPFAIQLHINGEQGFPENDTTLDFGDKDNSLKSWKDKKNAMST